MLIIILYIRLVTTILYAYTKTYPAVLILHCTVKAILFAIPNSDVCGKEMLTKRRPDN